LAAGTFLRRLGLYASNGRGDCVAVIDLEDDKTISGYGVSQVKWSACGNYLYVAERKSDEILVFDIRGAQKMVQRLKSRRADTMMRMSFDVKGSQLFAGGLDGVVRVWDSLGQTEGEVEPSSSWKAHDG
jgi:telomerase Cajal body protein 1